MVWRKDVNGYLKSYNGTIIFFFFFNIVGQFLKNSCIFQCNLEKKKMKNLINIIYLYDFI